MDTKAINDGGPAFPQPCTELGYAANSPWNVAGGGLSLRDYFAVHAPGLPQDLASLAMEAADVDSPNKTHGEKSDVLLSIRAHWNYRYADAMLAARNGGES